MAVTAPQLTFQTIQQTAMKSKLGSNRVRKVKLKTLQYSPTSIQFPQTCVVAEINYSFIPVNTGFLKKNKNWGCCECVHIIALSWIMDMHFHLVLCPVRFTKGRNELPFRSLSNKCFYWPVVFPCNYLRGVQLWILLMDLGQAVGLFIPMTT